MMVCFELALSVMVPKLCVRVPGQKNASAFGNWYTAETEILLPVALSLFVEGGQTVVLE